MTMRGDQQINTFHSIFSIQIFCISTCGI